MVGLVPGVDVAAVEGETNWSPTRMAYRTSIGAIIAGRTTTPDLTGAFDMICTKVAFSWKPMAIAAMPVRNADRPTNRWYGASS